MYQDLNLNNNSLSTRNRKGITLKCFHLFLNINVTIGAEERCTDDIFLHTSIAAGNTWNSAPIDGTYTFRNIPAISCNIHVTLDINLNALPQINQNNTQLALDYLKLIDSYRHFSSSILNINMKDCRMGHGKRIMNNKNLVILKSDAVIIAQIVIQSDLLIETSSQILLRCSIPYHVICITDHGSYLIRKLNKSDIPELKFIAYDLFPLFTFLKPCESFDRTNTHYFN